MCHHGAIHDGVRCIHQYYRYVLGLWPYYKQLENVNQLDEWGTTELSLGSLHAHLVTLTCRGHSAQGSDESSHQHQFPPTGMTDLKLLFHSPFLAPPTFIWQ